MLAYLPYIRTVDDIFTMMYQGHYAQFYSTDTDIDYVVDEWFPDLGYTYSYVEEHRDEVRAVTAAEVAKWATYTWDELVEKQGWETVFCNVANLTDLTFTVHYSEHYNIDLTVDFD